MRVSAGKPLRNGLFLTLVVAACSGPAPATDSSFAGPAAASVMTDGGKFRVELRTSTGPSLTRGTSSIELRVVDAMTDAPASDLAIAMVPWMPFMGHGTSVKPTVMAMGEGRYVLSNVNLYMPGHWELRTTFGASERAAPAFDIP